MSGIFYIFAAARFSWGVGAYGIYLTTLGVVALVSQVVLVRSMVSFLGERGAVLLGMLCLGGSGLIYAFAWDSTCMYVGLLVSMPGFVIEPTLKAAVARCEAAGKQGEVQGSLEAVGYVVKVISPLVSSVMLSAGVRVGWIGLPMVMFVAVKVVALRLLWSAFMVVDDDGMAEKAKGYDKMQCRRM